MSASMLIFPILVPFLFWAAYHYYHDRHRPEPVGNLLLAVLLGVGAAYLNRAMYAGLGVVGLRYDAVLLAQDNLPGLFAYAILVIGLTEELSKLVPFLLVVLRFRAFDEPGDGIVYASFLALGFSLVENLHYLQFLTPLESIARGFAGPLVHIVFASVWGYHIGLARHAKDSILRATLTWLAITAVLHGLYDFIVLGFSGTALVIAATLIVAVWVWRLKTILALGSAAKESLRSEPMQSPR